MHCGCADGSEGARLTSACVQAIAAAILRVEHKQGSSVAWATFISRMGNVYQLHGRCSSDAWATFISCMGDVHSYKCIIMDRKQEAACEKQIVSSEERMWPVLMKLKKCTSGKTLLIWLQGTRADDLSECTLLNVANSGAQTKAYNLE